MFIATVDWVKKYIGYVLNFLTYFDSFYVDDDKKNGNTKQNTANKDTVEPPVIRAEDNTINQSESGNNEVRMIVLTIVLLN